MQHGIAENAERENKFNSEIQCEKTWSSIQYTVIVRNIDT